MRRTIGTVGAGVVVAATVLSLRVPALAVDQAGPAFQDIWLYEAGATAPTRLTTASHAGRISGGASISGDGRRIVFHSDSDFLKEGIARGVPEIWLYDVPTRQLTRITTASAADRRSLFPAISADGSTVVFQSDSDLLKEGLPRGQTEVWRYTVATRALARVTRSAAGAVSRAAAVNASGSTIAIATAAWFGPDPAMPGTHLWLFDVATSRYTAVAPVAGSSSGAPVLSADGRHVAFERDSDIWLFDVPSARLTRVTTSGASRESEAPGMSADGAKIVFFSDADLLNEGRPDSVDEIWLPRSKAVGRISKPMVSTIGRRWHASNS
jgi:Tol biopolymer transport system component